MESAGVPRIDIPAGKGGEPVQLWQLRPEMAAGVAAMVDAAYHQRVLGVDPAGDIELKT
jgi:hypothetical protein